MNRSFNPSLRMPVFDVIAAVVLTCAAGYFWFQSEGRAQLDQSGAEVFEARAVNSADLAHTQASLADAQRELQEVQQLRQLRTEHIGFLAERIAQEERRITGAQERDAPRVRTIQKLDTEILNLRRHRADCLAGIDAAAAGLEEQRGERQRLESLAAQRRLELNETGRRLAEPPPSHFPREIGIDLLLEPRRRGNVGLVSLSRALHSFGFIDAGLTGSLGIMTGGEFTLLEGGIFFNMPLLPHRLSIDLETGMGRLQSRGERASQSEGYWGARLRFAPIAHERLYLLLGMRDGGSEDPNLSAGLALGRR